MAETKSQRRNLGVHDTEFNQQDKRVQALEAYQQRVVDYCKRELEDEHYVTEKHTSVANAERQRGNPLSWTVVQRWLQGLAPEVQIVPHPWKPDIVNFYRERDAQPWEQDPFTGKWGGRQRTHLMAGNQHMPEWTVMCKNDVEQPVNERDVDPDYQIKTAQVPWREAQRGWRQILAMLLRRGIVTMPQVEKFVARHGSSRESASWHGMVNKTPTRL